MAHEKPHNDDNWFDPHPGEDFDKEKSPPDEQKPSATDHDQSCTLAVDPTSPPKSDRHPDKQV